MKENNIITHCINNECRGFIYRKDYKCGLCNIKVCNSCFVQVEEENNHTCDQDVVKSIKQIQKDSKPCPKCHVPIYRIDGCNQMWCTLCKTAFDWMSLKILNSGRIHNPHLVEFLRQRAINGENEREDNAIAGNCNEITTRMIIDRSIEEWETILDTFDFNEKFYNKYKNRSICLFFSPGTLSDQLDRASNLGNLLRLVNHLADEREQDIENYTLERMTIRIRADYLNKKIDEKKFKFLLQRADKLYNYIKEINDIKGTYITIVMDLFRNYVDKKINIFKVWWIADEFADYLKEERTRIREIYNFKRLWLRLTFFDFMPYETISRVKKSNTQVVHYSSLRERKVGEEVPSSLMVFPV